MTTTFFLDKYFFEMKHNAIAIINRSGDFISRK